MSFVQRVATLYAALAELVKQYDQVRVDWSDLMGAIELAIVNRVWSLTTMAPVLDRAETLVTDFTAEWDGSQDAWDSFVEKLKGLFYR